jgi:hypothetical protein
MSSVEVLAQALESITTLTTEQVTLEEEKKKLMIQRTKLFAEFTSKLQGLPVALKKKYVLVRFYFLILHFQCKFEYKFILLAC